MSERRLLLGITGGIAAYKAPFLIRLFQQNNISVRIVATEHSLEFVTKLTLESLSGYPVYTDLFKKEKENFEHLELAKWAEVMLVAPATANSLAKFAGGIADDLLSTLFVALRCPVVLAPAMNSSMFLDSTVRENLKKLRAAGAVICEPGAGYLACGDIGPGRMAELETIVETTILRLKERSILEGKKVLVSAGATREPIDPVRFISNRSTGKMGYAVAEAFSKYGADVTLVSGTSDLYPPPDVTFVSTETAAQMHEEIMKRFPEQDIIVMAAAVADYTPAVVEKNKVKKSEGDLVITFKRTQDILGNMGANKKSGQLLIGFSAETENHLENSVRKLIKKNLDMIALNDVSAKDSGFAADTNRVVFIRPACKEAKSAEAIHKAYTSTEKPPVHFKEIENIKIAFSATPLLSKTAIADLLVKNVMDLTSPD